MKNKLGHQCDGHWRVGYFDGISIDQTNLAYCKSHNFVFDREEQEKLLHNGQPCFYTDTRYTEGLNFYKSCHISWKQQSLKACKRSVRRCYNIPVGTIVDFSVRWYYTNKPQINPTYRYKVTKTRQLDVQYEVNDPAFSRQFTDCVKSQELTDRLRSEGFLVKVCKKDNEDSMEFAIAFGYGKRIGYSSGSNLLMDWYSNGRDYILWDWREDFNKWSDVEHEIPKNNSINSIVEILKYEDIQ